MSPSPISDRVHLVHILETIEDVFEFMGGGVSTLRTNKLVRRGVERCLHTISESSQRLSEGLKGTRPEIPWDQISGFRNVIVHDSLNMHLGVVEEIVSHNLRPLYDASKAMLQVLEAAREGQPDDRSAPG